MTTITAYLTIAFNPVAVTLDPDQRALLRKTSTIKLLKNAIIL